VKRTESEKTGNHQLSTIANSIDCAVLDNDTLVGSKQALKRTDDPPQVRLIALVVMQPLSIENIVQSDHSILLVHSSTTNTTKFLHVCANTEQQSKVDAESSNVGTGFTANPENTKMSVIVKFVQFAFMDGSDTELTLDGGNERRALEEGAGQGLEGASELSFTTGDFVMETDNTHVLLTGALLGLDETGCTINADNQTTSDFGVEGTTVTGFLDSIRILALVSYNASLKKNIPENSLHPCHNLVTGRVRGLVEVDNTRANV
jgi:hypothetical protein